MKASPLNIGVLQMNSGEDSQENLSFIISALKNFDGAALFLPENSLYFNCGSSPLDPKNAFFEEHPSLQSLSEICKEKNVLLHLGGIPWRVAGGVGNQSVIIDPFGKIHSVYGKTHLFDLELGSLVMKESASFKAGSDLSTVSFAGWKMGMSICYDLRFSELYSYYRNQCEVDVLVIPSAFTEKTGEVHWETLLKARAIESQCFVIAPAQRGGHWSPDKTKEKKTWGQSLILSPWGQVLGQGPSARDKSSSSPENVPIQCRLDYDSIETVRKAMPMEQHRRFELDLELRCSSGNTALHASHFSL